MALSSRASLSVGSSPAGCFRTLSARGAFFCFRMLSIIVKGGRICNAVFPFVDKPPRPPYNQKRQEMSVRMTGETAVRLREMIRRARRIVFFGGAGVSTASGIPDFRSASGLYAKEIGGLSPEVILSRDFLYLQPEKFFDFYRKHMLYPQAEPNAAHRYLFELEKQDKLRGIVTQNIDGLHRAAGNIRVYELHGNVHENHCMDCNAFYPMEAVLAAEGIPRCSCGGVIRPDVVLYGEPLEKYVCIGARREIANADLLIVAGTSLAVEPAASFTEDFRGRDLVVINREPIPAEERAGLVIHEDVAAVFDALSRFPAEA